MIVPLEQLKSACPCGQEHPLLTRQILIEKGATKKVDAVLDSLDFTKRGVIICDMNTSGFAQKVAEEIGPKLHPLKPCIVLNPEGLHADEFSTAKVKTQLPMDTEWMMAVGSGTIHDITRYVCKEKGLNFVSFPTAASVDGFVSAVSAMTWGGYKKTLEGIAPIAVIADSDIFPYAPYRLTASGIGDLLGKYTALADWHMAHVLIGEPLCQRIYDLTMEAVDKVRANLTAIKNQETEGCEQLLYALLLSGLAMQMWGNSRPASGSEHHLSHLWEMEVINPHLDALHGEKVGIGLTLCMPFYKDFAKFSSAELAKHLFPYPGYPEAMLQEKFGVLYEEIAMENAPDPLLSVTPQMVLDKLPEIRAILDAMPDADELRAEMKAAGCLTTLEEIGLTEEIMPLSITLSPFLRKRITLMRLRKLTDL